MVGNLFWEHGHRMVATTVGLLTIAFQGKARLGSEVRRCGVVGSCRSRIIGRFDSKADVATGCFDSACNPGPVVLLYDR